MLFSKTVTHAVYILCHLYKQKGNSVVTAAAVAEAMGVPPEQAAKILQVLAGADLVGSVRGPMRRLPSGQGSERDHDCRPDGGAGI